MPCWYQGSGCPNLLKLQHRCRFRLRQYPDYIAYQNSPIFTLCYTFQILFLAVYILFIRNCKVILKIYISVYIIRLLIFQFTLSSQAVIVVFGIPTPTKTSFVSRGTSVQPLGARCFRLTSIFIFSF